MLHIFHHKILVSLEKSQLLYKPQIFLYFFFFFLKIFFLFPEYYLICIHNEKTHFQSLLSISNAPTIASLSATDVISFSAGHSVAVKSFAFLNTVEMCKEIPVVISVLTKVFCNFLSYFTVDFPKYYSINAHKSCCFCFFCVNLLYVFYSSYTFICVCM